jgi:hypothetical protein
MSMPGDNFDALVIKLNTSASAFTCSKYLIGSGFGAP